MAIIVIVFILTFTYQIVSDNKWEILSMILPEKTYREYKNKVLDKHLSQIKRENGIFD